MILWASVHPPEISKPGSLCVFLYQAFQKVCRRMDITVVRVRLMRGSPDNQCSGVLPRTLPETSGFVSDVTTHLRSPPTWLTTTVMIRFKTISGCVRAW